MVYGKVQMLQCVFAWTICAAAFVISMLLAEDTDLITPTVPEDPRQVLILFDGTSSMAIMTRRQLRQEPSSDDAIAPLSCRCPGLGDCKLDKKLIKLGASQSMFSSKTRKVGNSLMSLMAYKECLGLVGMWQAILITSLIVSGLSMEKRTWWELAFNFFAWAEWPVMMHWVVPRIIHQLTMLDSVDCRANKDVIRRVTLDSKERLLGYQTCLVQVASFAHRVIGPSLCVRQEDKKRSFKTGLLLCEEATLKQRHEFAQVFAAWDFNNNGIVDPDELVAHFVPLVGGENAHERAMEMVNDLIDYVDHDDTGKLDFDKCRALLALAMSSQHQHNVKEDLRNVFFPIIDYDGNGFLSMDEFTGWLRNMCDGVEAEDIANLVFKYFGTGKPVLSPEDFADFMMHIANGLH